MPSKSNAMAKVTSRLSSARSSRRSGRRNSTSTVTPSRNMPAVVIGIAANGSMPKEECSW